MNLLSAENEALAQVELWPEADNLGLLRQPGVIPSQGKP
jgi:hypothetical protein